MFFVYGFLFTVLAVKQPVVCFILFVHTFFTQRFGASYQTDTKPWQDSFLLNAIDLSGGNFNRGIKAGIKIIVQEDVLICYRNDERKHIPHSGDLAGTKYSLFFCGILLEVLVSPHPYPFSKGEGTRR